MVAVRRLRIARRAFVPAARGQGRVRVDPRAEVEVPDLVREGDVGAVCRPTNAYPRLRSRVHRVEVVWEHLARIRLARHELDLPETFGRPCEHRSGVSGRVVVDVCGP